MDDPTKIPTDALVGRPRLFNDHGLPGGVTSIPIPDQLVHDRFRGYGAIGQPRMPAPSHHESRQRARAMRAFDLMGRTGIGARVACEMVGTTPRTLIRWLDDQKIPWSYKRRGRGRPIQIVVSRTPEQKVPDFLEALRAGRSATAAATDLNTTVDTMSKQVLPDSSGRLVPIIDKKGRRWVANFTPLHRYSTVVYGKLETMDGNTLGRGGQAGLQRQHQAWQGLHRHLVAASISIHSPACSIPSMPSSSIAVPSWNASARR